VKNKRQDGFSSPSDSPGGIPEPTSEVLEELEKANTQLALYAKDLRTIAGREQEKSRQLESTNERLRVTAERLRESNLQVQAILDSITDGFLAVDRQWQLTYLNDAAERLLDRRKQDLLGRSIWEAAPQTTDDAFEEGIRRAAATGSPVDFETHCPHLQRWLDVHAYPWQEGLTVYLKDITGRKSLERQILQSQKLEVLGRLAGGVAHDFNNLLTAISGYSELAIRDLDPHHPTRADLEAIQAAAERAAGLTRQLLAFSRRQVLQPTVLDLNATVANLEKILRRLIGEDVTLRILLEPCLGRVTADPGQVDQVIMNLAINARDAMPRGGELTIQTANVDLTEDSELAEGLRPGRHVTLSVTDTGSGIDADTMSQMFEPFFTTKSEGIGTGLGLSTVYGIVEQSGGHIGVASELGRGTTFTVYFPSERGDANAKNPAERKTDASRGKEMLLLVEDEKEVRTLTRRILEERGYSVLEASCGEEALAIFEKRRETISLLLCDVVMPRMSGREVAESLADLRPDLKVLFMSGYTDDAVIRHGLRSGISNFLQKPFTAKVLAAKVREVLDSGILPADDKP
jgi:PAS domain S-box-containing protein